MRMHIPLMMLATVLLFPNSAAWCDTQQELSALPQDKYGQMVRLGHQIFTETPVYASRYAGNSLACSNCHLDAGRRPHAVPMGPAYVAFPAWREKDDRVNYFDDRVQQCFRFSLNGVPPALGSIELQALTAYAAWLAKGLPMGDPMVAGRGLYQIPKTGRDPNPDRGGDIYRERCAGCHDDAEVAPPLWGLQSYNQGAGLARNRTLAGWVKTNMPPGDENLTDQDALDVAAFVNFQFRPPDPRASIWSMLVKQPLKKR